MTTIQRTAPNATEARRLAKAMETIGMRVQFYATGLWIDRQYMLRDFDTTMSPIDALGPTWSRIDSTTDGIVEACPRGGTIVVEGTGD